MAYCYRCGKLLEREHYQYRRKVKTGEWSRKNYPAAKVTQVQASFGYRIVCRECARKIDLQNMRVEWVWILKPGLALIVLYGALIIFAVQNARR
jgi:hypothetical protein